MGPDGRSSVIPAIRYLLLLLLRDSATPCTPRTLGSRTTTAAAARSLRSNSSGGTIVLRPLRLLLLLLLLLPLMYVAVRSGSQQHWWLCIGWPPSATGRPRKVLLQLPPQRMLLCLQISRLRCCTVRSS
jgi:hypothetical protein